MSWHPDPYHHPMPVIVGVPRSGTTLMRFMLDSHPCMAIPPETGFLAYVADLNAVRRIERSDLFRIVTAFPPDAPAWVDFGLDAGEYWNELQPIEPFSVSEGLRAFYRLYARNQNKSRFGEKTPLYCEHIAAISNILPEARFIHIIRDGRDVALSLRQAWFAPAKEMRTLAVYWSQLICHAREAGSRTPYYMEVRYEDLVTDPQSTLERVCPFVDLEFHPLTLRYWERTPDRLKEHKTRRRIDGSIIVTHEQRLDQQRLTMEAPQPRRLFRWKIEMTAQERLEFSAAGGDMLKELGYEP